VLAGYLLAEMFVYSTSLRSMSQGRVNYSMEFEKYESVLENVEKPITEGKV